jgi:hypothetical protein
VDNGWRLKRVHKLIMTSAVYMQSNVTDNARQAVDRDNRLFWHRPGKRLEAELIRDSMLAVSERLDSTMYGPGTLDPKHRRRSIYFFVKRSQLISMMTLFDGPDTLQDLPCRVSTTIAPQALMLLNNTAIRESAEALSRRGAAGQADASAVVQKAFQLALSRPPSDAEAKAANEFVASQSAAYRSDGHGNAEELALTDFCQALLCLNEFVYIE